MTEDPSMKFVDPQQPSVSGMTLSSIELGQHQKTNSKSDEENQSAPTSAKSLNSGNNNNGSHYFPSFKQLHQQQQPQQQQQNSLGVSDSRRMNQTFTNGYASMRRIIPQQSQPHQQPPPAQVQMYRKEFLVPPQQDDPVSDF